MVVEEAFFDLDAPIRRLCGPDVPAMGYAQPLEEEFMISTERMARRDARAGRVLDADHDHDAAAGRDRHRRDRRAVAQERRRQRREVRGVRRGVDRQGQRRSAVARSAERIAQIIAQEGETVPTGAPIAVIDEVGAATRRRAQRAAPAAAASPSAAEAVRQGSDEPVPGGAPRPLRTRRASSGNGATRSTRPNVLRRVSPAVRRLAREHRVDLAGVRGTGTGGRITANDVLAAASAGSGGGRRRRGHGRAGTPAPASAPAQRAPRRLPVVPAR